MIVMRDIPNNIGEAIIEISKFCQSRPQDDNFNCDCPFWRAKTCTCIFKEHPPENWNIEKVTKYKIHVSE